MHSYITQTVLFALVFIRALVTGIDKGLTASQIVKAENRLIHVTNMLFTKKTVEFCYVSTGALAPLVLFLPQ